MELVLNEQDFLRFGLKNQQLVLTLRDNEKNEITVSTGEPFVFPLKIHNYFPLGNPPSFFAGYRQVNKNYYLSIFHANNVALHFSAMTDKIVKHPVFLLEEAYHSMFSLLEKFNEKNEETLIFAVNRELPIEYSMLKEINGLDTFLYNILIQKNLVVVGDTLNIIKLFKAIISLLPETHHMGFSFALNLYDPEVKLIGIDPDVFENYQEKVEELLNANFDLINLLSRQAFGEFTTPLTETLVNIPKKRSDMSIIKHAIKKILETAEHMNDKDITSITINGNAYTLTDSDKNFLLQVKEAWLA